MTWREETVECLKCDHRYTEFHLPYLASLDEVELYSVCRFGNQEFLKVCPNCGNDDVLETVYVTTEEENDKR